MKQKPFLNHQFTLFDWRIFIYKTIEAIGLIALITVVAGPMMSGS